MYYANVITAIAIRASELGAICFAVAPMPSMYCGVRGRPTSPAASILLGCKGCCPYGVLSFSLYFANNSEISWDL